MFPARGRYRIVASAFLPVTNPQTQDNFQLFTNVTARAPIQLSRIGETDRQAGDVERRISA